MQRRVTGIVCTAALAIAGVASAQTPAPHISGTVKVSAAHSLTVTSLAGQDVSVIVPDTAKVLQVAPDSKDIKSAASIPLSDIVAGDKVIVTGTAGDASDSLHAVRVIVMKSADIAQTHAAEEEAWRHGGGGLVKSVDTAAGTIVVSSGARTLIVQTTPTTKFHRYSGDSVKFEDAVASQLADIRAGDQLRVRGARSEDGSSIQADAIVTGTFRNFSGLLTAVDATGGTVTLKDLSSKKTFTVRVSANSDLRRIPEQMAERFAARTAAATASATGKPADVPAGNSRAGADLSQILSRLPAETLGGLKVGDAVMIVATQPLSDSAQPTAVTLLAGVEPILQASPKGDMTLTPWSVGTGAPDGGGSGAQEQVH